MNRNQKTSLKTLPNKCYLRNRLILEISKLRFLLLIFHRIYFEISHSYTMDVNKWIETNVLTYWNEVNFFVKRNIWNSNIIHDHFKVKVILDEKTFFELNSKKESKNLLKGEFCNQAFIWQS